MTFIIRLLEADLVYFGHSLNVVATLERLLTDAGRLLHRGWSLIETGIRALSSAMLEHCVRC